jgi:hypothetical protein
MVALIENVEKLALASHVLAHQRRFVGEER